jgi:N-acetylmuramic acid 6-phosphate etherase
MKTEQQNPVSRNLDQMTTTELLDVMNQADQSVSAAIRQVLPVIAKAIDAITIQLQAGGRLFYVGAGTSGRLGVLDAAECVPTFGVSNEMVQGVLAGGEQAMFRAIEGSEDDTEAGRLVLQEADLTNNDAVVGIAASGRTPFTLGAVSYANSVDALTVGVACNDPSPLLDTTRISIGAVVGPEILTGSTRLKAGTAQKMILNMISTGTMVRLGKVYDNLMVDVKVTNEKLGQRAVGIVEQLGGVSRERAMGLLGETDQQVKVAIVMARLDIDVDEAKRLLLGANGRLRNVIGNI